MPFQTTRPELSEEYKVLTQRERELTALVAAKETPTDELIAMWQALADDYEAEFHYVAADRCRQRIKRLTWA